MVLDGETVSFVLDPGDELKALGSGVDGKLYIIIVETPCPVVVILDHSADGNGDAKLLKDLKTDVDLSASAVHEDKVRELGKTSVLSVNVPDLKVVTLLYSVKESSGQNLLHARIIIRTCNGLDPELTIITLLGLALFIDNHGTYIGKTTDIGNIVGLHPGQPLDAEQTLNLLDRADGPALLALDPLLVLGENQLCILGRELHELLLLATLGHGDIHTASLSLGQPLLDDVHVLDLIRK